MYHPNTAQPIIPLPEPVIAGTAPPIFFHPTPPPIPDIDGDGKLTAKDILPLLREEMKILLSMKDNDVLDTTKLGKAIAIMRSIDTAGMASYLADSIREKNTYDPAILTEIAKSMTNRLELSVEAILHPASTFNIQQSLQKHTQDPVQDALDAHQLRTAIAFANSFSTTFPNGANIDPNEITEILELFDNKPGATQACRAGAQR